MRRAMKKIVRSSVLWLAVAYVGCLFLMAQAYAQ